MATLSVKFDRDAIFHRTPNGLQSPEKFHLHHTHGEFVQVPDWLFENDYFQQFVAQGSAVIAEVKSKAVKKPPSAEPSETLPVAAPHARAGLGEPPVETKKEETGDGAGEAKGTTTEVSMPKGGRKRGIKKES